MHFLLISFSIIAIIRSIIVFFLVFFVILTHWGFPHSFNPFLFFRKFWHRYLCIFLVAHLVQNDTIPSKAYSDILLLNFSLSVCNWKAWRIRSHHGWDDLMRQVLVGQLAMGQSQRQTWDKQPAHPSIFFMLDIQVRPFFPVSFFLEVLN